MTTHKKPTPTLPEDALQAALAESLAGLNDSLLPDCDRPELNRILQENWQRGRMQKFLEGDLVRVPDYVERVAGFFRSERARVHALQIERADDLWSELHKNMVTWNYRYLVGQGVTYPDVRELAESCATEAIPVLQSAHFPFDCSFNAWARVIVINVCRKHMRIATKQSAVPSAKLLELDDMTHEPADTGGENPDLLIDLVRALDKLNPARAEVIRLIYVDGLTVEQVAVRLGKTCSSVYNLHFQAVRELRKILHNWINDE